MNRSEQQQDAIIATSQTAEKKANSENYTQQNNNRDKVLLKVSPPSLCSYKPELMSQLAFMSIEPGHSIDNILYTNLSHSGFRRSGNAFYKPLCNHCRQCISSRVVVRDFTLSRRFRKILNRNAKVSYITKRQEEASKEHYNLYQRYITARHADGDMYPPSLHTFEQFLAQSSADTAFLEFRDPDRRLIAVAVTDKLANGLSSIYTFYDPDPQFNSRSLGVYCILQQIQLAAELGLPYVYLGYWIPTVRKMSYKTNYTPIELLINEVWQRFDETPDSAEVLKLLNTSSVKFLA